MKAVLTYLQTTKSSRKAALRVSIVIPVYNEAERIGDCLRAVAAQTVQPYEVIVVDNNSTDKTAVLAAQFPFVRLVREPRQGVVHARRRGFDEARGEIIGSIDADTLVSTDWVATVQRIFAGAEVDAVSGSMSYGDLALRPFVDQADLWIRRWLARKLGREMPLQATNMALRRKAWQQVRSHVCVRRGQHEDFDLAIHLNWLGKTVQFDQSLRATISLRQCDASWRQFAHYFALAPQSYAQHGLRSRKYMWRPVVVVVLLYPLLSLLHRGYDRRRQRFSLATLLRGSLVARVNPATFVD